MTQSYIYEILTNSPKNCRSSKRVQQTCSIEDQYTKNYLHFFIAAINDPKIQLRKHFNLKWHQIKKILRRKFNNRSTRHIR